MRIILYSAVNCSSLDAPDNGDVMVGMTTFESVATYSCDPSFRLIGVTTRTCQLNGSWSGEIPVCEGNYISTLAK